MNISGVFMWMAIVSFVLGQLFGSGESVTSNFSGKIRVVKFIDISCSDPNIGEGTSECEIKGLKGDKYKLVFSKTATSSDGSSMDIEKLEKFSLSDIILSANVKSSGSAATYNMNVNLDYLNI